MLDGANDIGCAGLIYVFRAELVFACGRLRVLCTLAL